MVLIYQIGWRQLHSWIRAELLVASRLLQNLILRVRFGHYNDPYVLTRTSATLSGLVHRELCWEAGPARLRDCLVHEMEVQSGHLRGLKGAVRGSWAFGSSVNRDLLTLNLYNIYTKCTKYFQTSLLVIGPLICLKVLTSLILKI
jgi:hypothetical protein